MRASSFFFNTRIALKRIFVNGKNQFVEEKFTKILILSVIYSNIIFGRASLLERKNASAARSMGAIRRLFNMSESICKFISNKDYSGGLNTVHFVYETEHSKLPQPFLRPIYYLFLVTEGAATLRMQGKEHPVKVGDLFFGFPGCPYELESDCSFRYLYISFFGSCVSQIFERLKIRIEEPVYRGFGKVSEFWFSAISRLNQKNADFLSESVILYTLSFIGGDNEDGEIKKTGNTIFEMILEYVNNHYREHSLSLSSVASVFFYTDGYLSSTFKKNMGLGFNQYVNQLRITYALRLIEDGQRSVRKISSECGFSDPLYFSKVFKKNVGVSPSEYQTKVNLF